MKHILVSLLLLAANPVFADGPGGGGTIGSDNADKCAEKTFEELKNNFTNSTLYGKKFEFSYLVSSDVKNVFDKNTKRDILEFVYSFEFKMRTTGELAPAAGYELRFADTCEFISGSSGMLAPNF